MGKGHLDPLAVFARLVIGRRVVDCPCNIAGILVQVAGNLALRCFRTTSVFERARPAVTGAGQIAKRREPSALLIGQNLRNLHGIRK